MIKHLADIINESTNNRGATADMLVQGIGDDTAVYKTDGSLQLATTDSLIQDTHFDLDNTDQEMLGYKAVAVNLSDIAAMGGIPDYVLVSLALPGDIEVDFVSGLYRGMVDISGRFGLTIAGGNISSSSKMMISITVIGHLENDAFLSRSAATAGEKIAVTGYTGLSAAGLMMLKQKLNFGVDVRKLLYEAHLKPVPRVQEGRILLKCGVRAAIDISDGLIADLTHICNASKVSATIIQDSVPVHPVLSELFKNDLDRLILNGGEDYELLFTASEQVIEGVRKGVSCPVAIIGDITEGPAGSINIVNSSGETVTWQQPGWEHFKS